MQILSDQRKLVSVMVPKIDDNATIRPNQD